MTAPDSGLLIETPAGTIAVYARCRWHHSVANSKSCMRKACLSQYVSQQLNQSFTGRPL